MPRERTLLVPLLLVASAIAAARADELLLVDDLGQIRSIDTGTGSLSEPQMLKGADDDPRMLAIATHPATGVVFGMGRHCLVTIDPSNGWTRRLGAGVEGGLFQGPRGSSLDVDPVANELRALVLTPGFGSAWKILRFDASTGAPVGSIASALPAVAYAGPTPEFLATGASIAHRADGTVLGIDPFERRLFSLGSPVADGVLTTITLLSGVPVVQPQFGFEIVPGGSAYVVQMEPASFFNSEIAVYRLDLETGAATRVAHSAPDSSLSLTDVSVAPSVPGMPIRSLALTKAKVSFEFARASRDAIEIRGTLPESLDGWKGKSVRVCIRPRSDGSAQYNREFVLDRRGRSRSKKDAFTVAARAKAGAVPFVVKLSRTQLEHFHIHALTSPRTFHSTVDALVDGRPFRTDFDLRYAPGRGAPPRRGAATRIP